jgi:hypothetical protein
MTNESASIERGSYLNYARRYGIPRERVFMKVRIRSTITPIFAVLGWTISTAALTLATIFLGYLLPRNINGGGLYSEVLNASPIPLWIFFIGNFAICVLAAVVISDFSKTLLSFFPSFIGAAIITYLVLALPDFLGCCGGALEEAALGFVFLAFFPLLLIVNLLGTLVGMMVSEHFS